MSPTATDSVLEAGGSVLRAVEVSKFFGAVRALDSVSLNVQVGEILGLIGPNGSGKSTLVNLISGAYRPSAGDIFIDDVRISGLRPDQASKRGIGRTFQTTRLFKGLTVHDNVASVMRRRTKSVDSEARKLLARMEIEHLANEIASSLAYGLQRRVEVARALGTNPRFLLLDEPAAGLNDMESKSLGSAIVDISQDADYPCGIVVIDHDMSFLSSLCHRIHVLANGKTLAVGRFDEVRSDPAVVSAYLGTGVPAEQ